MILLVYVIFLRYHPDNVYFSAFFFQAKHGMKHEGLYYTIDKASFDKLTYDLTYKDLRIQVMNWSAYTT